MQAYEPIKRRRKYMYWLPSIATGLKRLESMQTRNLLYTRIEARGAGETLTRNVRGYSSPRLSGMDELVILVSLIRSLGRTTNNLM